jgi:hypothetical protein
VTPGPWALRGRQIRAEDGLGKHVADYMVDAEDGHLLAAAPELEDSLRSIVDAIFHLPDVLREKVMDLARGAVGRRARGPRRARKEKAPRASAAMSGARFVVGTLEVESFRGLESRSPVRLELEADSREVHQLTLRLMSPVDGIELYLVGAELERFFSLVDAAALLRRRARAGRK